MWIYVLSPLFPFGLAFKRLVFLGYNICSRAGDTIGKDEMEGEAVEKS